MVTLRSRTQAENAALEHAVAGGVAGYGASTASIASADEDAETAALMAEMARLRAENTALAG